MIFKIFGIKNLVISEKSYNIAVRLTDRIFKPDKKQNHYGRLDSYS